MKSSKLKIFSKGLAKMGGKKAPKFYKIKKIVIVPIFPNDFTLTPDTGENLSRT